MSAARAVERGAAPPLAATSSPAAAASTARWRRASTPAAGVDVPPPGRRATQATPRAVPADCPAVPHRRDRRSTMTEAEFRAFAAQGYNRIPLVLENVRRPRYAAVPLREARQRAVLVPARVGRRRRALRPLLVHRAAGEDPHPRARHRDRSRRPRRHRRAARRRPARLRRRIPAPLPRGAATRAAAVLRRARGLVRLRHGAPHRDEARRSRAAARFRARRRARHPAAPDRGARRRRQPRRQDLAHRLRGSRRARCVRHGARALASAAPQAPRTGVDSVPDGDRDHAGAKRVRQRGLPAGGAAREGVHRRRAT